MQDQNPYEVPQAELEQTRSSDEQPFALAAAPRSNSIGHGWTWIGMGFAYFSRSWAHWVGAMILGVVIMLVVSLIPFVNILVDLLTLFIWPAGIALGCRAQAAGDSFRFTHLWAGFTNRVGMLILLSLVFYLLNFVIIMAALGPTLWTGMNGDPGAAMDMDPELFIVPTLIALLFILPLIMATFFAPHLIVFHDVGLFRAMKLSFVGCLKNVLPFLWWSIVMTVLTVIAVLPVGLGLLVIMPVSFASIYVAYEDIFLEDAITQV